MGGNRLQTRSDLWLRMRKDLIEALTLYAILTASLLWLPFATLFNPESGWLYALAAVWFVFMVVIFAVAVCLPSNDKDASSHIQWHSALALIFTCTAIVLAYGEFGLFAPMVALAGADVRLLADNGWAALATWLPPMALLGTMVLAFNLYLQHTIMRAAPGTGAHNPDFSATVQQPSMEQAAMPPVPPVPGSFDQVDFSKRAEPARPAGPTFKDVIGMEAVKAELLEAVEEFREHGGNGILLTGEPGNGKTFIAQALAGELGMRLQMLRAQEAVSKWMGEGTQLITEAFKEAKAKAPTLLFLDEVDSFMTSRSNMGDEGAASRDDLRSANSLMTAIEELNKNFARHKVLVVAASNFPEKLDQAGTRVGRFDKSIAIPPPEFAARMHLLKMAVGADIWVRRKQEQVTLSVKRWEGWSVVRIQKLGKIVASEVRKNPSLRLDAELLRRAVDIAAAGKGERLSESTPSLDQLIYTKELGQRLHRLAQLLREPEIVETLGVSLSRGAVFYGPAGTGKTITAQALAKTVGWRFISTTGPSLLQNPALINKIIDNARDARPCIVLIDEADGVIINRADNPYPYGKEVTNQLLTVLDGTIKLGDVFFIAATNFADNLDEAVVRKGRLYEKFDFTPDADSLHDIVTAYIKSKPRVRWVGSVQAFIDAHPDASPAKLQGLLEEAITKAVFDAPKGGEVLVYLPEVGR